jgi:MFS family permease
MTTLLALIGAKALLYLYIWLVSAIVASYLSDRKGYGEKPGLTTGIVLTAVGMIVWLIVPAKPDSKWKTLGPFGRGDPRKAREVTTGSG